MKYPNLFKRIVPFALALIIGLFLASFFVTLVPSFRANRGHGFRQWKMEYRDLKLENERLKAENEELKERLLNVKEWDYKKFDLYRESEAPQPPDPKMEKRLKEKLGRSDGVGTGTGSR
jgi:hypothetical protein